MQHVVEKHFNWFNVADFGANLDGSPDDAAWNTALAAIAAKGGGVLVQPAGSESTVTSELVWDIADGPLTLKLDAATVRFQGTGSFFRAVASSTVPVTPKLKVESGRIIGTGAATAAFHLLDAGHSIFTDQWIEEFENGRGFLLQNDAAWTENTQIHRTNLVNCRRLIEFDSGTGNRSFARTRVQNVLVSDSGPLDYVIYVNNGAGPYHCWFSDISGNLAGGTKTLARLAGAMGYSRLDGFKFEVNNGGGPTGNEYMFETGVFAGAEPVVTDCHLIGSAGDLRPGGTLTFDDFKPLRSFGGHAGYSPSGVRWETLPPNGGGPATWQPSP